jgi:hypothetical protein
MLVKAPPGRFCGIPPSRGHLEEDAIAWIAGVLAALSVLPPQDLDDGSGSSPPMTPPSATGRATP